MYNNMFSLLLLRVKVQKVGKGSVKATKAKAKE